MKNLIAILILVALGGCATITSEQKTRIAESRADKYLADNFYSQHLIPPNIENLRSNLISEYK
jgi:uncharacterized protein YceK